MSIYFVFCVVLLIMYLLCGNSNKYNQEPIYYYNNGVIHIGRTLWYYLFIFLILVLFSCFRYDVGMDYIETSNVYLGTYFGTGTYFKEPGYMILNRIFEYIGAGKETQIILYGFVTIVFVFLFIYKSEKPILSLAIFTFYTPFYLQTFNAIRQSFAIYIFMYAVRFIEQRKKIKYFSFIILGAFFAHVSLIVTLPLYFVLNHKYKPIAKILFILIFVFSSRLIIWMLLKTPYAFYIKTLRPGDTLSIINYIGLLVSVFMEIMLNNSENIIVWKNINLLTYTLFTFMFLNNRTIGTLGMNRIIMYFLPSLIILVPSYVENSKYYKRLKFEVIVCGLVLLFILSIMLHGEANHLVPYKTIFNKHY